jgi:PAT family beta-lactamase induction signal transducer AmpG
MDKIKAWLLPYLSRRMLAIFLLGFSSGLPIALVTGTLQAWFKTSGASIIVIGFMSLITQPYSYKFIWSPLLDKYAMPAFLDHRRSWILLMQLCLIATIACMSYFTPQKTLTFFRWEIPILFLLGFLLAIFSATQDIAIDAYRTELLNPDERGLGSALGIEGYRLAMIVSGGFSLILADQFGWQTTYLIMSAIMAIGLIAVYLAPKIKSPQSKQETSLVDTIVDSFKDFLLRDKAVSMLILIILYKLSDAFSHALSTTFLIDLQFSLSHIGMINKVLGVVATLVGVLVGGLLMTRLGLFRALLLFGILAAVTNLTYMLLAIVGKNYVLACSAVFIENTCAGMGTAAFVSLIMSLCHSKYVATQYALLSSLAALGRIYVGPVAAQLVKNYGWANFYFFTGIVAIPALLLLIDLRPQIEANHRNRI